MKKVPSITFLFLMYLISHHVYPLSGRSKHLYLFNWDIFSKSEPVYYDAVIYKDKEKKMFTDLLRNEITHTAQRSAWYQLQSIHQDKAEVHQILKTQLQTIGYQLESICIIQARHFPEYILSKNKNEKYCYGSPTK